MSTPLKELAVVIVNYRTPEDVSAAIASIERTSAEVVAEIVVVDNASADGSAETAARAPSGGPRVRGE